MASPTYKDGVLVRCQASNLHLIMQTTLPWALNLIAREMTHVGALNHIDFLLARSNNYHLHFRLIRRRRVNREW